MATYNSSSNSGGMSSGKLHDLSFAGSIISVAGITVRNFMDDEHPIDFPDVQLTGYGVNSQGQMLRWANPNAIVMSITVIPGSDEDSQFYNLWEKYRLVDSNYGEQWDKSLSASVVVGNNTLKKKSYKFGGGTMISGPGGPSATGEGKMLGRTYTFAFMTTGK